MPVPIDQIMKRYERATANKEQWRSIYEECYEFALPQRNLYSHYDGRSPGTNKMDRVFDSTAISSTQRFANRLQSSIFPPYRNWCRLVAGDDIPEDKRDEVQVALDYYNEKMFAVLRRSNFDLAMSEFLLDLAVGTSIMKVTAGDEMTPVRFEAVPQFLCALEGGANGKVDNVYRRHRMKIEVVPQQWPDAVLPDRLKQMLEDKPHEEVELLEATIYMPADDYYCYHVIWPDQKEELVYRELETSPWIVSRYMVAAGEVMGRGVLCTALSDIKTLNATKRMLLQNASINIAGMYTAADDGVLNPANINIEPGAIIPVARNGGPSGPSLLPVPRAGDVNLTQLVINDLTVSIKRILLDDTLPPDTMSARSATEIGARMQELASNMGAAFGRMMTECMLPLVSRILKVMDQENLIDMPMRIDGQAVKIVPISPLAKAQNAEETESILQFAQIAQQLGPMGAMALDQERTLAFIADRLGVPARVLTTADERAEMMARMEEVAQAAAAEPESAMAAAE